MHHVTLTVLGSRPPPGDPSRRRPRRGPRRAARRRPEPDRARGQGAGSGAPGSFIVLAILVRLFLYPRLKKGMDARHELIRGELETAEADAGRGRGRGGGVQRRAGQGPGRGHRPHRRRPPDARGRAPGPSWPRSTPSIAERARRGRGRGRGGQGGRPGAGGHRRPAQVATVAAERVLGRPVDPEAARAAVEAAHERGGPLMPVLASRSSLLAAEDPVADPQLDLPRGARDAVGHPVVPGRRLPAVEVRVAADQEDDGGPHGPHPGPARRGRRRPRPRPTTPRWPSARPRATSRPSAQRILAEADAPGRPPAGRRPSPAGAGGGRPAGQGRRRDRVRAGPAAGRGAGRGGRGRLPGHGAARDRARSTTTCSSSSSRSSSHGWEPAHERTELGDRAGSTATPRHCSRSPTPRARWTRWRTSCSASPAASSRSDSLRNTLTDEQIPAAKRQAIVEDLLGGRATADHDPAGVAGRRLGPGPGPAGHHRPPGRAGRGHQAAGRGRGALGRRRSPTTSRSAWPPRWPTPPASRWSSRSSSTPPCSAASSPPWATPSSTAASAPASTSSRPSCDDPPARTPDRARRRRRTTMAELTISAADITAALTKNLEGFEPSLEAKTVGRVTEVGDGIARVVRPARRGRERAARVRGRHRRPRPEPGRGLHRRRRPRRLGPHRGGPDRALHRAHPVGPGRRCAARPRGERARRAGRRQGPDRRAASTAGSRSRRPASWAASPCTSRCRRASRPSTP